MRRRRYTIWKKRPLEVVVVDPILKGQVAHRVGQVVWQGRERHRESHLAKGRQSAIRSKGHQFSPRDLRLGDLHKVVNRDRHEPPVDPSIARGEVVVPVRIDQQHGCACWGCRLRDKEDCLLHGLAYKNRFGEALRSIRTNRHKRMPECEDLP